MKILGLNDAPHLAGWAFRVKPKQFPHKKTPCNTGGTKMQTPPTECTTPITVEIDIQAAMAMPTHLRQHPQSIIRVRMLCSPNWKRSNNNSHAISWNECPTPEIGSS
jgi:hypothetical protein